MANPVRGVRFSFKYPENEVYVRVYKTEQRGHKLHFFVNFRKSPDDVIAA